jgi:hypothetical protein
MLVVWQVWQGDEEKENTGDNNSNRASSLVTAPGQGGSSSSGRPAESDSSSVATRFGQLLYYDSHGTSSTTQFLELLEAGGCESDVNRCWATWEKTLKMRAVVVRRRVAR